MPNTLVYRSIGALYWFTIYINHSTILENNINFMVINEKSPDQTIPVYYINYNDRVLYVVLDPIESYNRVLFFVTKGIFYDRIRDENGQLFRYFANYNKNISDLQSSVTRTPPRSANLVSLLSKFSFPEVIKHEFIKKYKVSKNKLIVHRFVNVRAYWVLLSLKTPHNMIRNRDFKINRWNQHAESFYYVNNYKIVFILFEHGLENRTFDVIVSDAFVDSVLLNFNTAQATIQSDNRFITDHSIFTSYPSSVRPIQNIRVAMANIPNDLKPLRWQGAEDDLIKKYMPSPLPLPKTTSRAPEKITPHPNQNSVVDPISDYIADYIDPFEYPSFETTSFDLPAFAPLTNG
nr:hypothetical protein [Abalone asfa-like virus]